MKQFVFLVKGRFLSAKREKVRSFPSASYNDSEKRFFFAFWKNNFFIVQNLLFFDEKMENLLKKTQKGGDKLFT